MARYFINIMYKGSRYAGFQVQQNANTIQAEVQKALYIIFKQPIALTCSSRTDAGVHAASNFFHFDSENIPAPQQLNKSVYNLNAILPSDIVILSIQQVPVDWHCRFTAISRTYKYYIYQQKNPFYADKAYFFPYQLKLASLQEASALLKNHTDFTTFSKRNTQVKTFNCDIFSAQWSNEGDLMVFTVEANRFLRGMVRGLVGTMLRVGSGKISTNDFNNIILSKNCTQADFSVPPQGLFLMDVKFPVLSIT
jgi:tRNA pseudouridine38-40 synthase